MFYALYVSRQPTPLKAAQKDSIILDDKIPPPTEPKQENKDPVVDPVTVRLLSQKTETVEQMTEEQEQKISVVV